MQLSQPTQLLIQRYQTWYKSLQPKPGVLTFHVDEVASAVASFYEKIRGVVDWKEEHLLRRAAIERALKRRILLHKTGEEMAEPLVLELIRGGHFPNDRIEETKIEPIKTALNKYLFLLNQAGSETGQNVKTSEKSKLRLYDWLMDIASCEIEEILSPPLKEKALIEYMAGLMKERIQVVRKGLVFREMPQEEKEIQIYIACQKSLFKLDSPIISYYLLQKKHPDWSKPSESRLKEITLNIHEIRKVIEKDLNHPLAEKFYKICEKYDTAYLILGNIISENPTEAPKNLSEPEKLEGFIKKFYQIRLQKLKSRLTRAAVLSTVSIFITKILLALAVEVPFDKYITGQFQYQVLALNIIIPPLLMLILVSTINPPKKENLNRVIMEVIKIAYEKEKKDFYTIKIARKRGFVLDFIITIFYLLTFILSFGLIIWALNKLNFGLLSMFIFLVFFSLISFAGAKIRERAKELEIREDKTGFLTFLLDLIALPFLRVGKWLSHQWSKYNVILVLMTALIDMPFQLFTEFLEHWRSFLKEKKEEIH